MVTFPLKYLGKILVVLSLITPIGANESLQILLKKNCKSNYLIQTLIYRSNIYYSKIYHKGTWKNNSSTPYLVMWQGIIYKKSASGSRTLHCLLIFFQSPILIWKFQKRSLNRGTLVPAPAIYQTKCLFLFFRCFPMI